jgi:hypothetical protein
MAVAFWFAPPATSSGRTPQPRGGEGAPPVRQTIPLRSIVCLTGGLGLRSLLQTKIYTTYWSHPEDRRHFALAACMMLPIIPAGTFFCIYAIYKMNSETKVDELGAAVKAQL